MTRLARGIRAALPAPPGSRTFGPAGVANDAHVDPAGGVDLDAAEKGDVEATAGGEVEEVGQGDEGARPFEQRGIDGRDRAAAPGEDRRCR